MVAAPCYVQMRCIRAARARSGAPCVLPSQTTPKQAMQCNGVQSDISCLLSAASRRRRRWTCARWSRCCSEYFWSQSQNGKLESHVTPMILAGKLPEGALGLCEVEPLRQDEAGSSVWIPDELQVRAQVSHLWITPASGVHGADGQ